MYVCYIMQVPTFFYVTLCRVLNDDDDDYDHDGTSLRSRTSETPSLFSFCLSHSHRSLLFYI